MEEQAFRNIGSALSGINTHTTTSAFITGSFSYTPDQMRNIVTNFLDLAKSYDRSRRNATYMASVEAPGLEYASESHATAARAMGQDYLRSLDATYDYCIAQAQKFQNTLDGYLGLEHRNVTQLSQAEQQDGPQDGI